MSPQADFAFRTTQQLHTRNQDPQISHQQNHNQNNQNQNQNNAQSHNNNPINYNQNEGNQARRNPHDQNQSNQLRISHPPQNRSFQRNPNQNNHNQRNTQQQYPSQLSDEQSYAQHHTSNQTDPKRNHPAPPQQPVFFETLPQGTHSGPQSSPSVKEDFNWGLEIGDEFLNTSPVDNNTFGANSKPQDSERVSSSICSTAIGQQTSQEILVGLQYRFNDMSHLINKLICLQESSIMLSKERHESSTELAKERYETFRMDNNNTYNYLLELSHSICMCRKSDAMPDSYWEPQQTGNSSVTTTLAMPPTPANRGIKKAVKHLKYNNNNSNNRE